MLTLANLATSTPGVLLTILQFLLVLTIVVFVHEFGHFIVARWCGVTVKTFSIGFGREIFGFTDRKGTRWRFAWIPLGGYVKFVDDENAASQPSPEALERMTAERARRGLPDQAAVAARRRRRRRPDGKFPFGHSGLCRRQPGIRRPHDHPHGGRGEGRACRPRRRASSRVTSSPASTAGPSKASRTSSASSASTAGARYASASIAAAKSCRFEVTPEVKEQDDTFGGKFRRGLIGITPSNTAGYKDAKRVGPIEAVRLGVRETYNNIAHTLQGIGDIVTQRQAADQMGGPILMAQVTARVAEGGIEPMLRWIAFISANIGFLNLLPIPVLDGGHLVYYAIEGVLRRPMSRRMQEIGFQIGVAMVLMLMVYVNLNDLLRVWRGWTGAG